MRLRELSKFKASYCTASQDATVIPKLVDLMLGQRNGKWVHVINVDIALGPQTFIFFHDPDLSTESRPIVL